MIWTLRSQPGPPELVRKASFMANISSFGVPPDATERVTDPTDRYQALVARLLVGMTPVKAREPWASHPPAEVRSLRTELAQRWSLAQPHYDSEYRDWFASQHGQMQSVLSHADERGEWVVSVHEFHASCFARGGTPGEAKTGDSPWNPPCAMPLPMERKPWLVPFGIAGLAVVGAGLAALALRQRRQRRQGGT